MIERTAERCNDDVGASLEGADLLVNQCAAVERQYVQDDDLWNDSQNSSNDHRIIGGFGSRWLRGGIETRNLGLEVTLLAQCGT